MTALYIAGFAIFWVALFVIVRRKSADEESELPVSTELQRAA